MIDPKNEPDNIISSIFSQYCFKPDLTKYVDSHVVELDNFEPQTLIKIDVPSTFPQIYYFDICFKFDPKDKPDDSFWHNFIDKFEIYYQDKLIWLASSQIMQLAYPKSVNIYNDCVFYQIKMDQIIMHTHIDNNGHVFLSSDRNNNNNKVCLPNNNVSIYFKTSDIDLPVKCCAYIRGGQWDPMPANFAICQYHQISLPLIEEEKYYKLIFDSNDGVVKTLLFNGGNKINPSCIKINNSNAWLEIDECDLVNHRFCNEKLFARVTDMWLTMIPKQSSYHNEIIICPNHTDKLANVNFYYESITMINF